MANAESRVSGQAVKLLCYALPAIPLAAVALPLYVIVPTFYAQNLGVPIAAVGTVLLLIRLLDAACDPLIGWLCDQVFIKSGRRRTFFLMSVPLTALAAFMVFWPPSGAGVGYLAFWSTLLSVGYTGTLLPYTAWGAELSTDYRGRSVVSAFREGATLVGTLIAVVLPFAVGLDNINGLHGLAAVAVLTILLLPSAAVLAVKTVPEPANRSTRKLSLAVSLHFVVRNRPFVRLIAAFLLNGFANAIPATLFLYFVSEQLGAAELRGPLLFLYFLCGMLGVPLAVWLAAKAGKHRTWCGAMTVACAVFAFAGFLGVGDIVPFAIICAATGLLLGFDLALPPAIQADVIDYDTASSGEQRSGLYFAAWGLATKLSLALGVGLVFPILGWSGFDATGGQAMPETALATLSALYAWLPILPKAAAIAVMWNFPLGEDAQRTLRARIDSTGRAHQGS
ncbi:Na+/melibiose symporter-like transporter [Aminobacter lissarensis]|uniref:Na+/melibiose symporter-like transporter n=1 Tax=Aminobacter carboxidus TaxID=376165 RepID=A0A8E1WK68_9HYPH|nr:MFS transporter [Aminobacter lissarensis]MBB6468851.1 Na+/melibiose symporter-like transporter [Aminobacter lissarensis]